MPKPQPRELPILQDIPKCRKWAGSVGNKAGYRAPAPPKWTRRLDAVFLHPVAGPLIFILVVYQIFRTIFVVAKPLTDGVTRLFSLSGNWVASALPDSLLRSLLIEGVWKGVGSVVVFLP